MPKDIDVTAALLSTFVLFSALVAADDDESQKRAVAELQGKWTMVKSTDGERDSPQLIGLVIEFKDRAVVLNRKGQDPINGVFSIDASKTPAHMDITLTIDKKERTTEALYVIKGDVMQLCHFRVEGAGRPDKIQTDKTTVLAEFKREK